EISCSASAKPSASIISSSSSESLPTTTMDLFKTGITLGVLVLVGIQFVYAQDVVNPIAPQDDWTVHEQFTSILQGHEPLHSPYTGPNSLFPGTEGRTSITATLFLGRRLWDGASFYVNP